MSAAEYTRWPSPLSVGNYHACTLAQTYGHIHTKPLHTPALAVSEKDTYRYGCDLPHGYSEAPDPDLLYLVSSLL